MTSRQVESFLLAGKYLSFTKAAEMSFMTRQAVSQQIALLEKELGTSLFVRDQSRLELSTVGRYYYDSLRRLTREWHKITEHAHALSLAQEQEIRIGCIYAMAVTERFFLMVRGEDKQRMYWERKEPFELVDKLLDGEFDLVMTFGESYMESQRRNELVCKELIQAETLLVYRKSENTEGTMSYFMENVGIISQDQLNEGKNLEKFRRLLKRMGIETPRIKLVPDRESVETMVEAGMGYTIGTSVERFPFSPGMGVIHTGYYQKIVLLRRKEDKRPKIRQLFEQNTI